MRKFEAALKEAVAECERTLCIDLLRASSELTIGDLARASRPVAELLARITIGDLTGDEVPQVNVRVGRPARTTATSTSRASPPLTSAARRTLLQVDQHFARVRAAMGRVSRSPNSTMRSVAEIPQVIDALEQWAREGRGSIWGRKSSVHAQLAGAFSDFRVSVDGVVAALDTLKRACGDFVTLTGRTWHINMDPNPAYPGVRPSGTPPVEAHPTKPSPSAMRWAPALVVEESAREAHQPGDDLAAMVALLSGRPSKVGAQREHSQ